KQTPEELARTTMLNQQEAQAGAPLTASHDAALQAQRKKANADNAAPGQYQQGLARHQQHEQQKPAAPRPQGDTPHKQVQDYNARISNPPVVVAAPLVVAAPPAVVVESPPDAIVTPGVVIENPAPVIARAPTVIVEPTTLVPLRSFANPDLEIAGAPV